VLSTPDGGQISLCWLNRDAAKKKVVMILVPGLNCSIKNAHVTHIADEARKKDIITVVVNYRGKLDAFGKAALIH
jgi:predicted alpha/beta-fold hydrolase